VNRIVQNMGEAYYKDTASPTNLSGPVSKSMLWDFCKSPNKWMGNQKDKSVTPAMQLGTLFHTACLEPDKLEEQYVISPYSDYRTKEARDWRDSLDGVTCVAADELARATAAGHQFRNNPAVSFLPEYNTEVAVFTELLPKIPCKGMIDLVPESGHSLIDLKTTANIESLDQLSKIILDRGYHWQGAMYLDLWSAATGDIRDEFTIIFMETIYPFEMATVTLDLAFIQLGRTGYMNALSKWNQCVKSNTFPPAVDGNQTISPPKWAFNKQ